ncbi:protein MFI-like isoform X2 [Cyclopterus lumpus]|uniref:protein MFI-like isoform X2 n=1 Tax=Cyclopterus lumpus TaxID=8103 RepID=UPI001486328C|nr:protein MFI-like isoform X2 [Cyclopterus lumpus]
MSSWEEDPRRLQETLQQIAVRIIQKNWRGYMAELLDAASGVFIRFRLGGSTFPPNIYYKIFTYRPIADLCANSLKDYTPPGSGSFQRMDNNSWRLFCRKAVPMNEPKEICANKEMKFHYSRLQRQRDVDNRQKKRGIEWKKKMYDQGRQLELRQMLAAILVVDSGQEAMGAIEEKGQDEVLDREVEELTAWINTLNFDEYIEEWKCLACSHPSEPHHGEHLKQQK